MVEMTRYMTCRGIRRFSDKVPTMSRVFEKYGLPGIIGSVDCTRLSIVAPSVDHPIYRKQDNVNHKHYHSVNVQPICNADMHILNANTCYTGAAHDAFIYALSTI